MRIAVCLLAVSLLAACSTTSLHLKMTKGDNECTADVKGKGIEFMFARSAAKECIERVDNPVKTVNDEK